VYVYDGDTLCAAYDAAADKNVYMVAETWLFCVHGSNKGADKLFGVGDGGDLAARVSAKSGGWRSSFEWCGAGDAEEPAKRLVELAPASNSYGRVAVFRVCKRRCPGVAIWSILCT